MPLLAQYYSFTRMVILYFYLLLLLLTLSMASERRLLERTLWQWRARKQLSRGILNELCRAVRGTLCNFYISACGCSVMCGPVYAWSIVRSRQRYRFVVSPIINCNIATTAILFVPLGKSGVCCIVGPPQLHGFPRSIR